MPDASRHIENALNAPQLAPIPNGAFALAATAVGLLLVAWLAFYFFIFLQRGPVG